MPTRVLVVDDESDTLNLLRTILEISGYEPVTTLNSVDALALAEATKPDVVLLDIMMPKLDGFMLCKMMRDNVQTRDLPIIFVTAYEALDLEDRRKDAGADLVIRKPIDFDALVGAVAEARRIRSNHTQLARHVDSAAETEIPEQAQSRIKPPSENTTTKPQNGSNS